MTDPLRAAALRIPGPEMEEFGTIDWRSWALSVRDAALAAEARPEAHPNWLRVGNVADATRPGLDEGTLEVAMRRVMDVTTRRRSVPYVSRLAAEYARLTEDAP